MEAAVMSPRGSDPPLSASLPQAPSPRPCGGWRPAPRRAKGTSRSFTTGGGMCCVTILRNEPSGAGSCVGSCGAGTSPPVPKSGPPLRWVSPVRVTSCTSATPVSGLPGPAPGPESCVSHRTGLDPREHRGDTGSAACSTRCRASLAGNPTPAGSWDFYV